MNQPLNDFTAVSGRIDEDGYTEILIDGDAFIQVCTTCERPIEFHESDELDEYGNCVNCQGGHHA